jgi:hypothetical protein
MDQHSPAFSESLLIAELAGGRSRGNFAHRHYRTAVQRRRGLSAAARQAATDAVQQVLAELDGLHVSYFKLPRESFSA